MNKSFHNLLIHSLQDMYDAEKQILKALPNMEEAATSKRLKQSFREHKIQTEDHVKRLEQIAKDIDCKLTGVPCVGMLGLIKEGEEIIKMELDADVKDAALIVAAQKVEHYEIVAYASMITHAKLMDHMNVVEALKGTLSEEKATDESLNILAQSMINAKAADVSNGSKMSEHAFHGGM